MTVAELIRILKVVAIVIAILSILLALIITGPAAHQNSLLSTLVIMPLFTFQSILLGCNALLVLWFIQFIRSRKAYDEHGAARQLKTIQDRIGTERELGMDSVAMGIQFLANSVLISAVILCFFLARAATSIG